MTRSMLTMIMALLCLGPAAPADDASAATAERRRLEYALVVARTKLLREDAELAELNSRILRLQAQLARRLDEAPEIAKLQQALSKLATTRQTPGSAPAQ